MPLRRRTRRTGGHALAIGQKGIILAETSPAEADPSVNPSSRVDQLSKALALNVPLPPPLAPPPEAEVSGCHVPLPSRNVVLRVAVGGAVRGAAGLAAPLDAENIVARAAAAGGGLLARLAPIDAVKGRGGLEAVGGAVAAALVASRRR